MQNQNLYQIRAYYSNDFIRVYQAYSDTIADVALNNQKFVSPPFSMTRMTWIKPSFLWMMYRAGWGMKDQNQKRILAIDIPHLAFNTLLGQAVLSHFDPLYHSSQEQWKKELDASDVVIQWDPERDIHLNKLDYRTIQIGLRRNAVFNYVNHWTLKISEVTELAHKIQDLIQQNKENIARSLLPEEKLFCEKFKQN